jgi:hypothetical protein
MPAGSPGAREQVERDHERSGLAVCLLAVGGGGPTIFAIYVWYRTRL